MNKPIGYGTERPENPLDEVVNDKANLNLDLVLSKAPSAITDADLDALIHSMRHKRALFIQAEAEKRGGTAELPTEETPEW